MRWDDCKYEGGRRFIPAAVDTAATYGAADKKEGKIRLAQNTKELETLQGKLYAEGSRALLVVFQAMDAAGKDGTIKHVFSGINPEGITVANFKQPSSEELAHDYLWRVHAAVPKRGTIGIFNRSHYEDVLISRVLNLPAGQNLPGGAKRTLWQNRYRQIKDFERYLSENGVVILKFFLHLSKEEQRRRFLARIDDESKNWKFEAGDLATRAKWDDYMQAYRECINHTATKYAPWYVVPADKKWAARLLVSDVVLHTLQKMAPAYPVLVKVEEQALAGYRDALEAEGPPPENSNP